MWPTSKSTCIYQVYFTSQSITRRTQVTNQCEYTMNNTRVYNNKIVWLSCYNQPSLNLLNFNHTHENKCLEYIFWKDLNWMDFLGVFSIADI